MVAINKIIINGRACSGKDELANYLVNAYGFTKISFATPIYDIAYDYFDMTTKDRKLLQSIGEKMREIDPDVWIKKAFKIAETIDKCVIADCRRENEYTYAVQNGFVPIRVIADLDKRVDRCIKRDDVIPNIDDWENSSEVGADHLHYRCEIYNNYSLEELYEYIDVFMRGWVDEE